MRHGNVTKQRRQYVIAARRPKASGPTFTIKTARSSIVTGASLMRLEVGKKYVAADGKVHGPLRIDKKYPDRFTDELGNWYGEDGHYWAQPPGCPFSLVKKYTRVVNT